MAAASRNSYRKPGPCYGRRVVFCTILAPSNKTKACDRDTLHSLSDCSWVFPHACVLSLRSLCAVAFNEADIGNQSVRHARRDNRAQRNHFPFFCNPVLNFTCIAALPGGPVNPSLFRSSG